MAAALYYNGVELENLSHTENKETTENRQTEKVITEATLILWIARLSGSITNFKELKV